MIFAKKPRMSIFIVSDETINSYDFIVKTDGIDLSAFTRNPVMLFDHDSSKLIGTWKNLRKENKQLLAEPDFDMDDPEAVKLAKKVEKGILKGASVGLIALEFNRQDIGDKSIITLSKSILKEISLTALPSNQNALRLYDADGVLLSAEDIKLSLNRKFNLNIEIMNQPLITLLGLQSDATDTHVIDAVKKMQNELSQLRTKVQDYENKEKSRLAADIKSMIDLAVQQGKLKEEQRVELQAMAEKDFESAKKFIEKLSVSKPTEHINTQSSGNMPEREKWTFHDWRKKDPKGLLELKSNEPDKYAEILKHV